jgi:hypothetical protein
MKNVTFRKIVMALIIPCMFSCSALNQGMAAIRNPKGFSGIGENVFVENANDMVFGERLKETLPALRDSVERKQKQKIEKMMPVFLCHTNESFCKYAGSKYPGPRAKVTNKGFFISPRLEPSKDWYEIIYHELSHVAMIQNVGLYRHFKTPVWFHEGLATYISNGGGSGDVSDSAAIVEILKGNHFHPLAKDNILSQKSFKNGLAPWMNYRQSMLFVTYLKEMDTDKFDNLIENMNKRIAFKKAFEKAYGIKIQDIWKGFLIEIGKR